MQNSLTLAFHTRGYTAVLALLSRALCVMNLSSWGLMELTNQELRAEAGSPNKTKSSTSVPLGRPLALASC